MGVSVFSQVWKVSDVYRLRADLGDADRPVLRRSPAWSEAASALYVDSLINGFPLSPLVVQSCRDAQGKSRLRVLDGWRRVEAIVAFAEDRLRLPAGFVFRGEAWGGESVEAAERAGVERVDEVGESAESVEGAAGADATADTGVSDAEETADSL